MRADQSAKATGADRLHEGRIDHVRVSDAMRQQTFTCPAETSLIEVAALMAGHRVHCAIVWGLGSGGRANAKDWGIVSDLDLARAIGAGRLDATARDIAATEALSISANDSLARAAQVMADHETAHLVVVEAASGSPVGVLSTLDIAGAVAG